MLEPIHYSMAKLSATNASLILDTKGQLNLGDEIGVFDTHGKLVGSAVYTGTHMAFPIWGDDPLTAEQDGLTEGDAFELRSWNPASKLESTLSFEADQPTYQPNGIIQASLLKTTGISSQLVSNSLTLFPNPSKDQTWLRLELTEISCSSRRFLFLSMKYVYSCPCVA